MPPSRGGRRPYLYTLGARGVPVVMQHLQSSKGPIQCRRLDRMGGDLFLAHDYVIASFWAHLVALLRRATVTHWRWVPERELRARHLRVKDPTSTRWLPVLPDGLFGIKYADGAVQCCLVEVDMGTLTLRRFRRKVRAFEIYLNEGHFARDWGYDDFEVLVLTRSPRRLEQLRQAAKQEVEQDRWAFYSFATMDVLDPKEFAHGRWVGLGGERYNGPLLDSAFAESDGDLREGVDGEDEDEDEGADQAASPQP